MLDVITPAEARSNQLLAEHSKYRLTFLAQTDEPVVTASVQGPTAAAAARVAAAIYPGLQNYVTRLQRQSGTPPAHYVTIRQLGPPQAGSVNSSARSTLTLVAFVGILLMGLLAVIAIEVLARRAREDAALESEHDSDFDGLRLDTSSLTTARAEPHVHADVGGGPARRR